MPIALIMKLITVGQLAAQGIPAAVEFVNTLRGKSEVDLQDLERDLDAVEAAHQGLQNS